MYKYVFMYIPQKSALDSFFIVGPVAVNALAPNMRWLRLVGPQK